MGALVRLLEGSVILFGLLIGLALWFSIDSETCSLELELQLVFLVNIVILVSFYFFHLES